MPPRELTVGIVAVLLQLLYSAVYPYVEKSLKSLPSQAETLHGLNSFHGLGQTAHSSEVSQTSHRDAQRQDGSQAKSKSAAAARKKTSETPKVPSRKEAMDQAMSQRMLPHMSYVTETFKRANTLHVTTLPVLDVTWDVHRVTDAEVPWAYMFRVGIKNVSPRPCSLQGVARFYVLRAPGGLVFPIHRVTEGPASFILNSGDEYKYSWMFFTKYKTLEAAGGLLLENRAEEDTSLEKRFLNTTLVPLQPAKANGITLEKAQSLMRSYNFMGALDLRSVTYQ
eukprot:TRINITY_DN35073_c0_g1_i1.p1 TRINITY_DN35073_c0_g1~~TRINITY_DN35073_c0_g1_i1.p1  ORF type:complete len:290 (-),score=44.51 TRINITY_DN35073_c0_g1_i1:134-976(-)